jgi:hypothetical protein
MFDVAISFRHWYACNVGVSKCFVCDSEVLGMEAGALLGAYVSQTLHGLFQHFQVIELICLVC